MSDFDIVKSAKTVWQDAFSKVNKAVAFVDDQLAECLHWIGGAVAFFHSGALNVKQFSSFESGKEGQRKAVFFISDILIGTAEQILQDILRSSHFEYVIIVSSLNPAVHTLVRYGQVEDELKAFHYLEDKILQWMGNINYSVELTYMPLASAAICSQLFVLSGQEQVYPLLPMEWDNVIEMAENIKVQHPTPADLDMSYLPKEVQLKLKLLSYSVNSQLEQLGVADDVYSLGHTSRFVATELANLAVAKQRRKSSQKKASILLIDRTLDLPNVLGHHGETLLDKILSSNDCLPGHHNDIAINMAPLCSVTSNPDNRVIAPGCMAQNTDNTGRALFHAIATQKHKEGLMEVNRQIVETASREGINVKLPSRPGRVTVEQIETHLSAFRGKSSVIQRSAGMLQIVQGVVQTLKSPLTTKHDSLLAVEKGLLQVLGELGVSPMNQLTQLLEKEVHLPENEREYSIEDLLGLLTFVYSLYDDEKSVEKHQEEQLRALLVRLLMETTEENLPSFITESVTNKLADEVTDIVGSIVDTLQSLTRTRKGLNKFSSVYEHGGLTSQTSLKPLLKQVMSEILQPGKQEIPDIEYKSTGLRDQLKRGLGLFMNVSKPRPGDHPLLLVFVIGGVTSSELRLLRETLATNKSSLQVILGSTRLVTQSDSIQQVLKQRTFSET